jgi:hypothetical protein
VTVTRSLRTLPPGMQGHQALLNSQARGEATVVLAGQLEAWARGHQEAFEIEQRLLRPQQWDEPIVECDLPVMRPLVR